MGAFYNLAVKDGDCTPISVADNKGCSITINITINRYIVDMSYLSGIAKRLYYVACSCPWPRLPPGCLL